MRTVTLDRAVGDVAGLFFELVKSEFEILSISIHQNRTNINLEDEEEKDPRPLADPFLEAPAKSPSRSMMEERREVYRKYLEEKPFRMENLRARHRVSQEVKMIAQEAWAKERQDAPVALIDDPKVQILALAPSSRKSLFQKLKDLF